MITFVADEGLSLDSSLEWRLSDEGGIYATDDLGEFQLGLAAPVVLGESQEASEVAWELEGVQATVSGEHGLTDETVQVLAGVNLIKSVAKATDKGKPRYLITPTVVGRAAPVSALAYPGWKQAISKGVKPTTGLYRQYICHPMSQIARPKSSWNIEQWRPTVSLAATVAAACNPS